MSWKRYLVHLSVLCLLGTAAALANPCAETTYEGVTYGDVWPVDPPPAGVASVQEHSVQLDTEEEMRLFLEEHVRFLAALSAREAHAVGECLETR